MTPTQRIVRELRQIADALESGNKQVGMVGSARLPQAGQGFCITVFPPGITVEPKSADWPRPFGDEASNENQL